MLRAPSIDAAGLSGAAAHEDEHPYSDVGVCAPRGTERWDFGEGVEVWRPGHQLVWQGDRDDRGGQLHAHVDGRAAAPGGIRAAEPDTSEGAPGGATIGGHGQVGASSRTALGTDGRLLTRLERDPDVATRGARERARYHAPGERARPGFASGSVAARLDIHKFALQCSRPTCRALVDLRSALAAATAAGRMSFVAGDGCGSRACSRSLDWRARRFGVQQRKVAKQLLDGARVLMAWPADKKDKERWFYNAQATRAAADFALAANPVKAPKGGKPALPALAALRALAAAQPAAALARAADDAPTRASVVALSALAAAEPAAVDAVLAVTSPGAPTRAALDALLALAEASPASFAEALATADPTLLDDAAEAAITALAAAEPAALAAALAATPPSAPSRPALAAIAAVVFGRPPPPPLPLPKPPPLLPPTPTRG